MRVIARVLVIAYQTPHYHVSFDGGAYIYYNKPQSYFTALSVPERIRVVAIAVGDLLQITDSQTYLGEQLLNIYYYQVDAIGSTPDDNYEDLVEGFNLEVVAAMQAVQVTSLLHTSRTLKNLTNGLDFFVDTSVIPGLVAATSGQLLPSYVSLGFMLLRSTLSVRNGYKRIGGLTDQFVDGNTSTYPLIDIDEIEENLANSITTVDGATMSPVIVKRPIPAPGEGDPILSAVASAQFRGLGTQNTRKPGRGI